MATIDAIPGGNTFAYALGMISRIPLYMIRQFATGFADRTSS